MRRLDGPLARREFRTYFLGNLSSNVGTWLANVALGVYMLELTGSSFWVGLTNAALFIPTLLFAIPAGALADRKDRLRVLTGTQILSGALATLLAVLVVLGVANRYVVVAIAVGLGMSIAIGLPAMQSLVPSLVPPVEMAEAIGLNALTFNLARAVGPILAAITIAGAGVGLAFTVNAASYAALIYALVRIGTPPFLRERDTGTDRIRDGLVFAWRHKRIRTMLFAVMAMAISLDPILTLSPALAEDYGLPTGGAGWIVSAWGGGAVLGITAGRRWMSYATKHGLGWAGLIGQAAGLGALAAAPNIAAAIPAAVLVGAGYITAAISFTTAIQEDAPERLRGRVMALWSVSFLGPRVFGSVIDGALADAYGPHVAMASFTLPALVFAYLVRRMTPPRHTEPVAPAA
ncbi:MAG: MFS transporter [Actinomycetota bacterium]